MFNTEIAIRFLSKDVYKRQIFMNEGGTWRVRYNHELYELLKGPKLSDHIKLKRLKGRDCTSNAGSLSPPQKKFVGAN